MSSSYVLCSGQRTPPARIARAMTLIEHNLGESWLTPQRVAQAQRISRRHLDELFAAYGYRIDSWIWERRLVRASEELAAAANASQRNILEIALDLGFKSPSHFSRSFAGRFGISPSKYRKQRRALDRPSIPSRMMQ